MGSCPYCGKQINDGDRFCLNCGRQLDIEHTEEIKSGGISDLKECFGLFPKGKIDCYLCADEQKCANYSASKKQNEILLKLNQINDVNNSITKVNNSLKIIDAILMSIDNNIGVLAKKTKR